MGFERGSQFEAGRTVMDQKKTIGAIVLAAGRGVRMKSKVQKQYLMLGGHQVITYSLRAFEESRVDSIVLVVSPGDLEYGKKLIEEYKLKKVVKIVEGGKERYHSVYEGLKALGQCDYVLIHDGARPFVTEAIIDRAIRGAEDYGACVISMPVKDTIKLTDALQFVTETPRRDRVWLMQTPQAFSYSIVRKAYDMLAESGANGRVITDDAMVVETFLNHPIKLVEGAYSNIKLTTPEDMVLAEALLKSYRAESQS